MRLVVADTGPLNYLVLIGQIDLLPTLFGRVLLPEIVKAELASARAPSAVKKWSAQLPDWIVAHEVPSNQVEDAPLIKIDAGERAAIQLATLLRADLLLMDDRKGIRAAQVRAIRSLGTLGILDLAAQRGLLNLADAFAQLRRTNFRCPEDLMRELLAAEKRND